MSAHAEAHDEAHVDSPWLYVKVYVALLILTVLTVMVSTTFGLGDISHSLSLTVAMIIAAAKGSLVVLFFMHVLHDQKLIGLIVVVSLFFMGLFFSMTMFDVSARGSITSLEDNAMFRNLNNIGVVNELPEYGHHGEGDHGEGAGAHGGAEGEEHAAEGEEASGDHAAEGEGDEQAAADETTEATDDSVEGSDASAEEEGEADDSAGSEDGEEATEQE